jgi:hypothetical protein
MGLTLTVTCAAEVPAFQYQGRVLQVRPHGRGCLLPWSLSRGDSPPCPLRPCSFACLVSGTRHECI